MLHADGSGKIAVVAGQHRLTYDDLVQQAGRFAAALHARGVGKGERVAVSADKSLNALLIYLACMQLGAIYLPLNTGYTAAEIDYFASDAEPIVFICQSERADELRPVLAARKVRHIETLDAHGEGSLTDAARALAPLSEITLQSPSDIAAILYTSGTTGRPKGAMLTHANLVSNALALIEAWHYSASDVLLHALPIFHAHGLFVGVNVTLIAGAGMIFLPQFNADEVAERLGEASVFMGVPTFYTRLMQHPKINRASCAHMRVFISGSAPLLADVHHAWTERTGHAILERYGMTETVMNSSNPYDGERVPGSVGFPLPGIDIRIADPETGAPQPVGTIGSIELKGPNVFSGYWRQDQKTKESFRVDGYFITGDMGRFDERGYLYIVGRAKDLVITGGYNVYPKEVETEMDAFDEVVESAVVGIAHPDFGEGVTAFAVLKKGATLSEADAIARLRKVLAAYKCPKRVFILDELPRNTMGKVQKELLRQKWATLYQA